MSVPAPPAAVVPCKVKKMPMNTGQNIKVFVRVRPVNDIEKNAKAHSIVDVPSNKEIVVHERPLDKYTKKFAFDRVFDGKSKQQDLYRFVAKPLVEEVLNGFNCTIFAYGQTGTGKTFTMEGDHCPQGFPVDDNQNAGIIPRCVNQLFDELRIQKLEFTMRVSFLELYNEEVFDLLSAHDDLSKLRLYEDASRKGSCIIHGLEEVLVRSKSDVYSIVAKGSAKRQTAATLMNAHSSRSHTVFTVTVHIKENTLDGDELLKAGKLHLVDLAGSENIGRSGAMDKRAREAGNINQSLLTLGRVITSLVEKAPHIPYRESKLTRLLQDALGGRTKTSIIATVSPASVNLEETLSTLDYAHRAKNIQNKPEVNQKLNKKELIGEYTNEIEKLRRDLLAMREKNGVYLETENYNELVTTLEQQAREIAEKISQIRAVEADLEKQIELFCETEDKLKSTCETLSSTERNLSQTRSKLSDTKEVLLCTQKLLSQTASEKEEQRFLVSAHLKTEEELLTQGKVLLRVAEDATSDISQLQDKLDRKRKVESLNEGVKKSFGEEFAESVSAMTSSVFAFKEHHHRVNEDLVKDLGSSLTLSRSSTAEMRSSLLEMNRSLVSAVSELQGLMAAQLVEGRGRGCRALDAVGGRGKEEEGLATRFMGVVEPLVTGIGAQLVQQHSLIQRMEQEARTQVGGMRALCSAVHERQGAILSEMEERVTNMAEFPALLRKEMEEKSRRVEEEVHRQAKAWQDISLLVQGRIQAEIGAQQSFFGAQMPLLAPSNTAALEGQAQEANLVLGQLKTLQEEGQGHHQEAGQKQQLIEGQLAEALAKLDVGFVELKNDVVEVKEKVERRREEVGVASSQMRKMAEDAKEEMERGVEEARKAVLGETKALTEDMNAQLDGVCEQLSESESSCAMVVSQLQEKLHGFESELEEFLSDHEEQLRESGERVEAVLHRRMVRDEPTGLTPHRRDYPYPQSLPATSPHERLLHRYRFKVNGASKIPLYKANIESEDEFAPPSSNDSSTASSADLERSGEQSPPEPEKGVFLLPPIPPIEEKDTTALSRSSSTSSLTDSKENLHILPRRAGSTKKREIKPPAIHAHFGADKIAGTEAPVTRARKILGSFN